MLCSVDTFGIGSFAPMTPKLNPPSEPGDTAFVVIYSPIRTAARRYRRFHVRR